MAHLQTLLDHGADSTTVVRIFDPDTEEWHVACGCGKRFDITDYSIW